MSTGEMQETASRHKETVVVLAMTSEAGAVSVSYSVAATASRAERREIARKMAEVTEEVRLWAVGDVPTSSR